jgi:hypothetical protein
MDSDEGQSPQPSAETPVFFDRLRHGAVRIAISSPLYFKYRIALAVF